MSFAARFVLKSLARLSSGRLTVRLPDGTICRFGPDRAERQAEIDIKDWRFFRRGFVEESRVVLDGRGDVSTVVPFTR